MDILEEKLKYNVRVFVALSGFLTLIGLVFIYSSSSIYALEKFGSAHYFLKKQFFYLIPAFIGFAFFARISVAYLKKITPYLFLFSIGLMVLTILPKLSISIHGSRRWLSIFGFNFQPSEFLKLFLFMYIGFFLERKQKMIRSFLHSYLPFLLVLGCTFVLLLLQPDFGSVVTIFATAIMIFFVAEFKMIYLGVTLLCAFPFGLYLIVAKPYRLNRILVFLNPWADPQGSGFQIIQSLIAIGSGQLWGLGISGSKQKFFYLPMQHTDFIFPIIAEETGFIGSVLIVVSFFLFCLYGMRIALSLKTPYAFFTSLGFVMFMSLQAIMNLMVTTGLLPTKGLGLPFVSYGGTALVSFFCMVGLIVNFARLELAEY
ncbi:MAG: putative lipid II flippase FtsW [bacterium]